MKFLSVSALTLFALAMGTVSLLLASPPSVVELAASPPTEPVALLHAEPVAVVELFTSEGCSSCPSADRLLVDLAERDNPRVLPLAFHVDYWNRLGWADPFSDAAFSQRQRAYARAFQSGRVYTPQMIVNGQREFVGSRRHEAQAAIKEALAQEATASVSLLAQTDGPVLSVAYAVEGAPEGAVLHLALVQRHAEQAVPRGENRGKTLRHANVVRAFETVAPGTGTRRFTPPAGLRFDEVGVVAYVQDPATMQVFGAAEAGLRATEPHE